MRRHRETIERLYAEDQGRGQQLWTRYGYRPIVDVAYRDGLYHLTWHEGDRFETRHTWPLHAGEHVRVRRRDPLARVRAFLRNPS